MFKLLMKCAQILAAGDLAYTDRNNYFRGEHPRFFQIIPADYFRGVSFF